MRRSLALLIAAGLVAFIANPAEAGWKWKKMRWESKKAQTYQPPRHAPHYGYRQAYRGPYNYRPYGYGRGYSPYSSYGRPGWDW